MDLPWGTAREERRGAHGGRARGVPSGGTRRRSWGPADVAVLLVLHDGQGEGGFSGGRFWFSCEQRGSPMTCRPDGKTSPRTAFCSRLLPRGSSWETESRCVGVARTFGRRNSTGHGWLFQTNKGGHPPV
ncbi:unnamed protein product [Lampetra planeri]